MSRGLFRLVGVWSGCWVLRDAIFLLFPRNQKTRYVVLKNLEPVKNT
jgi:hypothetical protein